jgi:hypothetical protein
MKFFYLRQNQQFFVFPEIVPTATFYFLTFVLHFIE